jgi:outer membrane protein assembly factor BamB
MAGNFMRRDFRAGFWGFVAATLLTGCSSLSLRSNPLTAEHGAHSNYEVFTVNWSVGLVDAPVLEYAPREMASPAVDRETGRIIVLTRDGFIRCLNPKGEIEWRHGTSGRFSAGATIVDGVAYVPGGDGVLYAFVVKGGKQLWAYSAGEELASSPVVTANQVLVLSHGDTLYAVDRATGAWKWQYRRDPPTGFSVRGVSQPRMDNGFVYLGFADGYVVSLNAEDGALKWQKALGSTVGDFVDVDASPILDESGRIYVASYKEGIFGLDAATGDVQWQASRSGITSLLGRSRILYAGGDEQVEAVHADNGRMIWTVNVKDQAARTPVLAGKTLVVPLSSSLLFVDAINGQTHVNWDPGQGVSATPVWVDHQLYVLSNLGYLYSLSMRGGG